ncbi:hypothetical protein MRX96_024281 [Rhipicephalus microplus]
MAPTKRKSNILQDSRRGFKVSALVKKYELAQSTISTILKAGSTALLKAGTSGHADERKRVREPLYADVEEALYQWFLSIRAQNVPISGPILATKVLNLAFLLGRPNFEPDGGWIQRFKERHGIVYKNVVGEAAFLDSEAKQQWLQTNLPANLKISLLKAVRFIYGAWYEVRQTTIQNCFRKAGFVRQDQPPSSSDSDSETGTETADLTELWEHVATVDADSGCVASVEDFLTADSAASFCDELTDEAIVADVLSRQAAALCDGSDSSDEEVDSASTTPSMTTQEDLEVEGRGQQRVRFEKIEYSPDGEDEDDGVEPKYDGVARLCRKCRLPGQERKKCATQQCTRCEQWGHPTCDARTLQALWWGSPSTPLQAKAVLGGNHVVQCAAKVEPSTAVSAEVQGAPALKGAPAPKTSDKGKQGETIQAGPGEAWYKIADRKSQDRLRPLSPLRKSRFSAPTHLCKHRNPSNCQKKQEGAHPSTSKMAAQPAAPLSRRWREGAFHPSCQGAREVTSSSQALRQPSMGSCGREENLTSSESSRWKSDSPTCKRHAATVMADDDSSTTTVEDSEMDWASCDLCKSVVFGVGCKSAVPNFRTCRTRPHRSLRSRESP